MTRFAPNSKLHSPPRSAMAERGTPNSNEGLLHENQPCPVRTEFARDLLRDFEPLLTQGNVLTTPQRARLDRVLAQLRQFTAELDPKNDALVLHRCACGRCMTRFPECGLCAYPAPVATEVAT